MDALEALHSRTSAPKLSAPGPSPAALQAICKAAFRAADHGLMRPWRFLLISGDARHKLGALFAAATLAAAPDSSEDVLARASDKALRAPLIVVTIASPVANPKVPDFEQEFSAAAATQNMLLAAHAQQLGAIWRTGAMAVHPLVRKGLGLADHEKIISFLYLGTIDGPTRRLSDPEVETYFKTWG